jgi:hypothetical protein
MSQEQLDYNVALRNKPTRKYCYGYYAVGAFNTVAAGANIAIDTFTTNDS